MSPPVQHDSSRQQFFTDTDGVRSVVDYTLDGDLMTITHTGVPAELGGRGIAGELTRAAFTTAREQGWKVMPACSYAAGWVEKHAEFKDLLQ